MPKRNPSTTEQEFDAGNPLRNQRHELFCYEIAKGSKGSAAYSKVYGTRGNSSEVNAYKLLRNAKIVARVRELQTAAAKGKVMDLAEMLEFLSNVKRTPVGEITADHELAQRVEITEDGTKVWMPDKRACVELCARLQGMLVEKAKVEHSGKIDSTVTLTEDRRKDIMERRRAALEQAAQVRN